MDELLRSWVNAQSWRELTHVRVDNPYYAASAFLAVLAYPADTDKRDRLIAAMRAYCRFTWSMTPGMRKRDIARALDRGNKLVNRRFRAAGIAAMVMLEKASSNGMTFEAARSIREAISREGDPITVTLSLGVLPAAVRTNLPRQIQKPRPDRPGADEVETNIFRDVWSPSKPVLHLAHILENICKPSSNIQSFGDLIVEPSWASKAIDGLPTVAFALCQGGIVSSAELIMLRPQ